MLEFLFYLSSFFFVADSGASVDAEKRLDNLVTVQDGGGVVILPDKPKSEN
jgi:hypothetical protein